MCGCKKGLAVCPDSTGTAGPNVSLVKKTIKCVVDGLILMILRNCLDGDKGGGTKAFCRPQSWRPRPDLHPLQRPSPRRSHRFLPSWRGSLPPPTAFSPCTPARGAQTFPSAPRGSDFPLSPSQGAAPLLFSPNVYFEPLLHRVTRFLVKEQLESGDGETEPPQKPGRSLCALPAKCPHLGV